VIFVTVGAQMPFDRLVQTVDQWAADQPAGEEVFAQINKTSYLPQHIKYELFIPPLEFRNRVAAARVIIAHAGMGSIITALEFGKPIIVMPRRGSLKETRNDHQFDAAKYFRDAGRINVALDERELRGYLDRLDEITEHGELISHQASPELISNLMSFIDLCRSPRGVRADRPPDNSSNL
jgi:UDP-N-acetylglucosamine transferase subunit ALG13